MRTTRKRVPVPFLFRAADGLGANGKLIARVYGNEVEGVVTRAGKAAFSADNGAIASAPHSVPRLSTESGEAALLVEPQLNNVCIYSEDFSNWTDSFVTVSTNATTAPDGTVTADLLTTATGGGGSRYQAISFTGNSTKSLSVYLKQGTATITSLGLYDFTAGVYRHRILATWGSGVPTLSTAEGAGTLFPVQSCGNGWYRVMFTADSVVAANTNRLYLFPHTETANGTVYAWGAQAEDLVTPTSYYPTTAVLGTRIVDRVYFPFTLPPQGMTVYCRYIHRGALRANLDDTAISISDAALNTPRFALGDGVSPWTGTWQVAHANGSTVTSSTGSAKVFGDVVEMRGVLSATGTVLAGESLNGAAETTGSVSGATALASAWSATRLYVGTPGTSATTAPFAFTHICVAVGTKTMAEMRVLAEVL